MRKATTTAICRRSWPDRGDAILAGLPPATQLRLEAVLPPHLLQEDAAVIAGAGPGAFDDLHELPIRGERDALPIVVFRQRHDGHHRLALPRDHHGLPE